jgi:hypothetical protein
MKDTLISWVSRVDSTKPKTISLEDTLEEITSGKYESQVERVRVAFKRGGKKDAGPLKRQLPAILFSGRFSERNDEGIQQHSGILVADLDELECPIPELRNKLKEDPHVIFVFLSPTGSGLKVGFKVPADADRHANSFAAVAAYMKQEYGEDIDPACKNLSRLCFASHDPDLHINWEAEELEIGKAKKDLKLTMLPPKNIDLPARRKVAEKLFSPVNWVDDSTGYIQCPGESLHTNPDSTRDCKIHIDGVPNVYCLHSSCIREVDAANVKLKRQAPATNRVPEIWFNANGREYWRQNNHGGWITNNETQVSRVLRKAGFSRKIRDNEFVSPLDEELIEIQEEKDVQYSGPLAGFGDGMHEIHGRRILVTESPRLIEPVQGEWPILRQLFDGILCADGIDQRPYFFGWLKVAIEALRARKRRPGQVVVFCGKAQGGKSLSQNLVTHLLGGRVAKPYQFMSAQTAFNGDLLGAEHLMIEDEQAATDIRSRRALGAAIKAFAVNEVQHCHEKHLKACELTPFWRVTISVNDEPEHLQVLPPLEDSLEDKIMLLKAYKKPMPIPSATIEDREAFMATLMAELPAFVYFLINEFVIPKELVCQRFGVTHYHHPLVLEALNVLAPEARLLSFIDAVLFSGPIESDWEGTAEDLQRQLNNSDHGYEVRQLLKNINNCGTYLGRLAKQTPQRVFNKRTSGSRNWVIKPLGGDNDGMTPSFTFSKEKKSREEERMVCGTKVENLPSCRHEEIDLPLLESF